jgi:predicted small lipoprotein YifL
MRVNRLQLVLLLALSAALIGGMTGCGKKGPLYIPPENSAMRG